MAAGPIPPAPRDLLAHADGSRFWIAQVGPIRDQEQIGERTTIWYRGRFDSWETLPPLGGRVVSMASSGGELLLVMADGQWLIADGDQLRPGPSAPEGEKVLAIANEADEVWAIVLTNASATHPTTTASTSPSGRRLVAFRFSAGRWVDPNSLPDAVSDDPLDLSMTVVDQLPWIAWRGKSGTLLVIRLGDNHTWLPVLSLPAQGPDDFKLLTIQGQAALWRDTSQLTPRIAGTLSLGSDFSRTVTLSAASGVPVAGAHTLAFAFERLRWLAEAGDQPIDQSYDLQGHAVGELEVVRGPQPEPVPIGPCVAAAAAAVLIAAGSALRQRRLQPAVVAVKVPGDSPSEVRLRLAPLGVRFSAALVDLLPCVAAVGLLRHGGGAAGAGQWVDLLSIQRISALSLLTYLLHTTVAEMICGQSVGKMLFGARIVGPDGQAPSVRSVLVRNLLRMVDLGPVGVALILLTPLHQRLGDLAAGTVVIATDIDRDRGDESA